MTYSIFDELEGWDDFDRIEGACFRIAKDINECTANLKAYPVTPSEACCVQAIADGYSHHEAAEHIGVTFYTLQSHLKNAKLKLSAKDKYHLIGIAFRDGVIT